MSFGKTKDALTNISSSETVSLDQALGFFLDFCDDCGGRIDKLDIENSEEFVKSLRRCNRVMLDIIKKCDVSSVGSDAMDKFLKQQESMLQLENELELEEQKIQEASKNLEGKRLELELKKKDIQALRDEKLGDVQNLESDIALLKKERDNYVLKIAELQNKLQNSASEAENAEKEYQIRLLRKQEVSGTQQKLLDDISSLSKEIEEIQKEVDEKLKPAAEQLKLTRLSAENKAKLLKKELEESETTNKKLADEYQTNTNLLKEQQLTQSKLLTSISESKKQITDVTNEIKSLREVVDKDDETLLIKELEHKKSELVRKKEDCEALKKQIKAVDEDIKEASKDVDKLKSQVDSKEGELNKIKAETKKYNDNLASISSKAYDIAALSEKATKLKNISEALEKDSRILAGKFGGSEYKLDQAVAGALTNADGILKKVRKGIETFIKVASFIV